LVSKPAAVVEVGDVIEGGIVPGDVEKTIEALKEAVNSKIPIIGLCDANNETKYVDLVIPANNKGRRSLAVVYWLLTKEYFKAREDSEKLENFKMEIKEFEATL